MRGQAPQHPASAGTAPRRPSRPSCLASAEVEPPPQGHATGHRSRATGRNGDSLGPTRAVVGASTTLTYPLATFTLLVHHEPCHGLKSQMRFSGLHSAIPDDARRHVSGEGPYRWSAAGSRLSAWGTPQPPPRYPFAEPGVRWLDVGGTDGRLRVTDYGTKGPGDYIIFAEWPAPHGSSDPTYWEAITYRVFFHALLELTMGNAPWLSYLRGVWAPFALECILDLADTSNLPPPRSTVAEPESPASARMLLDLLVLFSVDESRNYADFWKQGGGRYMPARIALGVIFGTLERRDLQFLGRNVTGGSSVQTIIDRSRPPAFRLVNPRLPVNPPEGTPGPRHWWSYHTLAADRRVGP